MHSLLALWRLCQGSHVYLYRIGANTICSVNVLVIAVPYAVNRDDQLLITSLFSIALSRHPTILLRNFLHVPVHFWVWSYLKKVLFSPRKQNFCYSHSIFTNTSSYKIEIWTGKCPSTRGLPNLSYRVHGINYYHASFQSSCIHILTSLYNFFLSYLSEIFFARFN